MELLNELPEDVPVNGHRQKSALRQALETMRPGDILATDRPPEAKYARQIRAMIYSMNTPYRFSVHVSQSADAIVVWCRELLEDSHDEG